LWLAAPATAVSDWDCNGPNCVKVQRCTAMLTVSVTAA
jgi:hypothetical protein